MTADAELLADIAASGPGPAADPGPLAAGETGNATAPLAFAPAQPGAAPAPQPCATDPAPHPGNPFANIDFGPQDDDGPVTGPKVGDTGGAFALSGPCPAPQSSYYVVSGLAGAGYGFLTLRDRPDSRSMPLGSLSDGDAVEVLEANGEWVYLARPQRPGGLGRGAVDRLLRGAGPRAGRRRRRPGPACPRSPGGPR